MQDDIFGISRESAEMQNAISAAAGRSRYLGRAGNRSTKSFEYLAPGWGKRFCEIRESFVAERRLRPDRDAVNPIKISANLIVRMASSKRKVSRVKRVRKIRVITSPPREPRHWESTK
jgi:hypothetical protein